MRFVIIGGDGMKAIYNCTEIQDKIKVIDEEFDMPEPVSDPVTSKLTDADKYHPSQYFGTQFLG